MLPRRPPILCASILLVAGCCALPGARLHAQAQAASVPSARADAGLAQPQGGDLSAASAATAIVDQTQAQSADVPAASVDQPQATGGATAGGDQPQAASAPAGSGGPPQAQAAGGPAAGGDLLPARAVNADTASGDQPQAQAAQSQSSSQQQTGPMHPVAFQYPPGYATRLAIHKDASYATLPLFATELVLGNMLYNNPDRAGVKTAHGIVATGIVGLFGVNTVTGVWNLWDDRKNPEGRRLRIIHSVAMLVADGGFAATALDTPHTHGPQAANFDAQRATHRNLAYFSVGVGTFGYAIMLFWHH